MHRVYPVSLIIFVLLCLAAASVASPLSSAENLKQLSTQKVGDSFTFVVLGDNRSGDKVFRKLLAQIEKERDVAFVLHAGDMVNGGFDRQFLKFGSMIEPLSPPFFSVMGNHDILLTGRENYTKYFGSPTYFFDYGDNRFIILDNAEDKIGDVQFAWLEELLRKSGNKKILVSLHRPTFDPTEVKKAMTDPKEVARLNQLMDRYKVRYVFFGHNHLYAKRIINGRVEIITGGAGSPLYAEKERGGYYHYVKVRVDVDRITDEVVPLQESGGGN